MRPRYWHIVLGVFFLGWIFMYADRTVLSPVLPSIGAEWNLNRGQLGLISSLFFLTYAALQIPTGLLADRFGRKLLLVPGYLLFGATTLISAFAPTYGIFVFLAAVTGIGEGAYYPTQFSLSSEVIPQRYRGLGSAIINSGQAFGISLGLIASSFVAFHLHAGWRAPFGVLGVATMGTGIIIWLFIREHPRGAPATPRDKQPAASPSRAPVSIFSRDLVLVYIVMFCSLYGFFVILTWLPYYLVVSRHMPASTSGVISSFVPWASLPGALILSYFSDRFKHRRVFALIMLPIAGLAIFLIPISQNTPELFGALILYGLIGKLALDPILVAFVADRVPTDAYSRAYAFFNFAGMSSSIVAPIITGFLADRLGSLNTGFYLATALLMVGAVCMTFTRPEARGRLAASAQVQPGAGG